MKGISNLSNLVSEIAAAFKDLASEADLDQRLGTCVNLIQDFLDAYYVGLFLVENKQRCEKLNETLDTKGQWFRLRAGTGKAGQHKVYCAYSRRVDMGTFAGRVLQTRQAFIALDVGENAVYFGDPYLPLTRSEIALPLAFQEEVIGVLDIQSAEEAGFSNRDISLLQPIADLLAEKIYSTLFKDRPLLNT